MSRTTQSKLASRQKKTVVENPVVSTSATAQKIVKKGRKRTTRSKNYGEHVKKQKWFNAFGAQKVLKTPQEGIHSLKWALNIVPQTAPLFTLPVEVRQRIFTLALIDDSKPSSSPILSPGKCGKKFINNSDYKVEKAYTTLSLVSRQTYLDVVGSGLLHKLATFSFNSPMLMSNYMLRINPSLRVWISDVKLNLNLNSGQRTVPASTFTTLVSLAGLTSLSITLSVHNLFGIFRPYATFASDFRVTDRGEQMLSKIEHQEGWNDLTELGLKEFSVRLVAWTNWGNRANDLWMQNNNQRFREFSDRIEAMVMKK